MNEPEEQENVCSICGLRYVGYGCNAWPVNPGRCCVDCDQLVIQHRINNVLRGGSAYGYPPWWNKQLLEELMGWDYRESKK